jgi:hypothetical protein
LIGEFEMEKDCRPIQRCPNGSQSFSTSVPLEVLNGALVRFGLLARGERSQVSTLTRLRVLLAGVQAVFSGRQFSNHAGLDDRCSDAVVLLRAKKNRYFPVSSCTGSMAWIKSSASQECASKCASFPVQL